MGGRGSSSMSSRMGGTGFHISRNTGDPSLGFADEAQLYDAIHNYWSVSSGHFRHPENEKMERAAVAFDAELEKMSYSGSIYRGVTVSPERLAELEVGARFDHNGPASWSKSQKTAEDFADINHDAYGGQKVVFVMHGGTKHGGDISDKTRFPYEEEVATSSKSSQEILKKRTRRGIIYIEVQEV